MTGLVPRFIAAESLAAAERAVDELWRAEALAAYRPAQLRRPRAPDD